MSREVRLERLLDFLQHSPTPWHAVARMAERLESAGYRRLDETRPWRLEPGERVYVTRNDSSIVALQLPREGLESLRMIGAHTDSPGLRLKPHAAQTAAGWLQLGVELYGGVLLAPWFDRDLGLAGRVHVCHPGGEIEGVRSEERRVGKECRSRWSRYHR